MPSIKGTKEKHKARKKRSQSRWRKMADAETAKVQTCFLLLNRNTGYYAASCFDFLLVFMQLQALKVYVKFIRANMTKHPFLHTHIHTDIHTYTYTYIHTYIYTYVDRYIHTYVHRNIHTRIHKTYVHKRDIHAFKYTCIHEKT